MRRHALVWVARDHHHALIEAVSDPVPREIVAQFLAAGSPLVVRCQPVPDGSSPPKLATLAMGLPLPPAQGKQRLAFSVPAQAIVHSSQPLRLAEVIPQVRTTWRSPLTSLLRQACASGIEFRVFGSASWEALTGHPYLTSNSDIDLLWRPADTAQIAEGIALLHAWENDCGLKADGEIVFGDDAAVAWREWGRVAESRDSAKRVLVKTLYGPRMSSPSELAARLPRNGAVRRAAAAWW